MYCTQIAFCTITSNYTRVYIKIEMQVSQILLFIYFFFLSDQSFLRGYIFGSKLFIMFSDTIVFLARYYNFAPIYRI